MKIKSDKPHNIKQTIKIYFLLKVFIIDIETKEPKITPIKTKDPKNPKSESSKFK